MRQFKVLLLVFSIFFLSSSLQAAQLDINTATAQQLEQTLKGIGSQKARAIVQYREQHGPFRSLNSLAQVKGIGKKMIESNRERMVLGKSTSENQ